MASISAEIASGAGALGSGVTLPGNVLRYSTAWASLLPVPRRGTREAAARTHRKAGEREAIPVRAAYAVISSPDPPRHAPVPEGRSMFEYFPATCVRNLGVLAALSSGGFIDEAGRACRPPREPAGRGEDGGTEEFPHVSTFAAGWVARTFAELSS
jgi:hypothetical protein